MGIVHDRGSSVDRVSAISGVAAHLLGPRCSFVGKKQCHSLQAALVAADKRMARGAMAMGERYARMSGSAR